MSLLVVMSLPTLTASQVSAGYFKRYLPSTACYLRTFSFIFTARCYASAVLAMGLCLCLSQVGVLLKQQTVDHTHNTARYHRESSFLVPKISAKFDRGPPYEGAECKWGGKKSATFDK